MKPRVLQLIGSFHNGGSERQAVQLTRLLKEEASFDVSVATLNGEGVLRSDIEKLDIGEIAEYPLTSFFRPSFVRQVRALAAYLRREKIDVIHTHDFYTNVVGMAAAALAGTYVRIASKRETDGMRSGAQDRVERIAFGAASAIVVNSKAVCDHLIARGIKESRLELIYNGVDMAPYMDPQGGMRDRYGFGPKAKLITLVANLRHDVKNVPMFLRVADRITEERQDVEFVIAGEGELKSGLETTAADLGLQNYVHFIGRCEDVPALLSESYAGVLTSIAEGFSNSILEYMAAGKPVVATDVGGAKEAIVEAETGYVVASNDDAAMADRLNKLTDDPALAARLGANGRARIGSQFSKENQLTGTLALYNKFLRK